MRPIVVFFAFANDRVEGARYLRNLAEELRRVRAAMAVAEEAGLCEVVDRANATADEVLDVFQSPRFRDRVAIFHFGGHAGGAGLLLESAEGRATLAHAGGLARFLGQQRGLTLVFLNGCSTAGQVQGLLDAGVPAVIATSQAIKDAVATELSARFYQGLASGASLKTAFAEAQAAVRTRVGNRARDAYCSFVPEVMAEDRWPWDLYVAPGSEERLAHWSLPLAAQDPLFGLPAVPEMDLPSSPFKHLDWFTREDAQVFYGRGREIRDLYEAVTALGAAPIVLLFGATGVGKSSLLAAGLTPRLEESHEVVYLRRDGTLGLTGTLAGAFGDEGEAIGNDLGAAWRAREKATGKPLVVILDQAEEAWTSPLEREKEEGDLAAALQSIFAVRENRPLGRLILGFRKEWLAEVLRLIDAEALPRTRVEVTHLSRDAIAEVVTGPASTERLRQQYRLEIEPALPAVVADDLSEDAGSAVAPTLQILLSKIWAVATQESPGMPRFTLARYQRLKREGILLDDFLEEQLAGLRQWRPEVVDSGLALDLLAHHTTPLGTAETRQAAVVVERYGGRPEVVELLGQCKDRYLLTGTARVQKDELVGDSDDPSDKGTTRLAHDTLAPLVRRRFEISDLPGQRALRILQQRAVEWSGGREGPPLDDVSLGLVEQGERGMPAWSSDELRLVEVSRREREQRVRRRRALRIGATVAAAVIAVSAGVAWWQRSAAIKSEQRAQDNARVALASDLLQRDPTRAALVLLEVAKPDETVSAVSRLREVVEARLSETILRGRGISINSVAFSPDGRRVVTVGNRTAWIWSVDGSSEPLLLNDHEGWVRSASFGPDGRRIVTASSDKTARVWSVDGTGEPVVLRGHEGEVSSASFSPDGRRIATASSDKTARVWSVDGTGEPVVLRGHEGGVSSASFSPDGRRIVTASSDKTARVWSVDGIGEPVVLRGHEEGVSSASFSPNGRRVVTVSDRRTVRVWSADSQSELLILTAGASEFPRSLDEDRAKMLDIIEELGGVVTTASLSPDSQRVVTASSDNTVARIWSIVGRDSPTVLRGHEDGISAAAFSPDGRRVVTASEDGTARIWSIDGMDGPIILRGHEGNVSSASFSPDGRRVVTASEDGTARIWPIDSIEPVVLRGWVFSAFVSPDGRRIVTTSVDKTARVWWSDGTETPVVLRGHGGEVGSASFSPDGRRIVTVSSDKTAWVWSVDGTGEPVVLRGHEGEVRSASFSPDGRRIVTASKDETVRVWRSDGADDPLVLRGHEGGVWSASFSPDGRQIVTVSEDETVRVWRSDGVGDPLVLRGHKGTGWSVSFSPDGRRIVTVSEDRMATRVWSVDSTGAAPLVLRGHESPVYSAIFSPDGRRVVTVGGEGTARAWWVDGDIETVVLREGMGPLVRASFSPDGQRVVTSSGSDAVRIWSIDGSGEPVILRVHEGIMVSTGFSPDGSRVVTMDPDRTARIWAVSGILLQALVRAATSVCLEAESRVTYLGESKSDAQATYDRCRRCVGPWRRQFDRRSIYAAPDEAWSKWQACMRK